MHSTHMYIGLGWKNQTSKCMHQFMLSNSSTELTHESATNISTQEIGVLCHNVHIQCMCRYKIADDQETFSLCGRNLKIFKSER